MRVGRAGPQSGRNPRAADPHGFSVSQEIVAFKGHNLPFCVSVGIPWKALANTVLEFHEAGISSSGRLPCDKGEYPWRTVQYLPGDACAQIGRNIDRIVPRKTDLNNYVLVHGLFMRDVL
jgi:hypothetical protein